MPDSFIERRTEMLRQRFIRRRQAARRTFGAPAELKDLALPHEMSTQEKGRYFNYLKQTDPAKAQAEWDQMTDAERATLGG